MQLLSNSGRKLSHHLLLQLFSTIGGYRRYNVRHSPHQAGSSEMTRNSRVGGEPMPKVNVYNTKLLLKQQTLHLIVNNADQALADSSHRVQGCRGTASQHLQKSANNRCLVQLPDVLLIRDRGEGQQSRMRLSGFRFPYRSKAREHYGFCRVKQ